MSLLAFDIQEADLAQLGQVSICQWLAPLVHFPGSSPALLAGDNPHDRDAREHFITCGRAPSRNFPIGTRIAAWSLFRLLAYQSALHAGSALAKQMTDFFFKEVYSLTKMSTAAELVKAPDDSTDSEDSSDSESSDEEEVDASAGVSSQKPTVSLVSSIQSDSDGDDGPMMGGGMFGSDESEYETEEEESESEVSDTPMAIGGMFGGEEESEYETESEVETEAEGESKSDAADAEGDAPSALAGGSLGTEDSSENKLSGGADDGKNEVSDDPATNEETKNKSDAKKQRKRRDSGTPGRIWTCAQCTYLNKPFKRVCKLCQETRKSSRLTWKALKTRKKVKYSCSLYAICIPASLSLQCMHVLYV